MGIETKTVRYAKEIDDVILLAISLLRDIRAGKSAADITAGNVPELMAAIAGADQIGLEIAASPSVVSETIGYRLGEIAGVFLAPIPVPAKP